MAITRRDLAKILQSVVKLNPKKISCTVSNNREFFIESTFKNVKKYRFNWRSRRNAYRIYEEQKDGSWEKYMTPIENIDDAIDWKESYTIRFRKRPSQKRR